MLRNFIRDRGTQLTLGTFVASFVYAILALGSIGQDGHENFVPHLTISVSLVLMVADLAVLIFFLNHVAGQIQLPQVIAGIAADLAVAIEAQAGGPEAPGDPGTALVLAGPPGPGGAVNAPRSGYLQFIDVGTLVKIASATGAVIRLRYRPGHFLVQGHPYATVWPASARDVVASELSRAHVIGPYRTLAQDVAFGVDQLVEIAIRALGTAVNDTFTTLTCIDWIGDSLCKVTGRWRPSRVYADPTGTARVITTEISYERLVQRSFEKIRQAGRGMPAVLIRQLDALAKIMERTTSDDQRAVLLGQAEMIERSSAESIPEPADRADVTRRYEQVLAQASRRLSR
jgi:uncharacterized membrane protein